MKVTRLEATDVHGYLPIAVSFLPDLTFLTGLNGSGKTSALKLLMGLLTPDLEELAGIQFVRARVTVLDNEQTRTIEAVRSDDSLTVSTSGVPEELKLDTAELELLAQGRRREEARMPLQEKIRAHPVFKSVHAMSTPMFLGLDRRFFAPGGAADERHDLRLREHVMRRHMLEEHQWANAAGLIDVNVLLSSSLQRVRFAQEQLDNRLRNEILVGAFQYKRSNVESLTGMPSRADLENYKKRQLAAEKAVRGLKLPVEDVQRALTVFFERMTEVVENLEKTAQSGGKKKGKRHVPTTDMFDWIMNRPQTDRILEHLKLLEQYNIDRAKLHESIDNFIALVNRFLTQTTKSVELSNEGELRVIHHGAKGASRPIWALSSGERQIVVMLAHLSLNPRLAGSGVFIVDEPELSLHLAWQERFVDAIRTANPNVQLIMATHSPAIILDHTENCRSLSEAPLL